MFIFSDPLSEPAFSFHMVIPLLILYSACCFRLLTFSRLILPKMPLSCGHLSYPHPIITRFKTYNNLVHKTFSKSFVSYSISYSVSFFRFGRASCPIVQEPPSPGDHPDPGIQDPCLCRSPRESRLTVGMQRKRCIRLNGITLFPQKSPDRTTITVYRKIKLY